MYTKMFRLNLQRSSNKNIVRKEETSTWLDFDRTDLI